MTMPYATRYLAVFSLVLLTACSTGVEVTEEGLDPEEAGDLAERLRIPFDEGFEPLNLYYGPNDNPATADPAFTVEVAGEQAIFVAPAAAPGARLTGFLDLPQSMVPIAGDLLHEWTFPDVQALLDLGGGTALSIAACYVRGALADGRPDWTSGDAFGGYWLGFVRDAQGTATSAIRSGQNTLTSEPFTATRSASYRLEKRGATLRLYARYDDGDWHAVGEPVALTIRSGGSDAVHMTHVRILDVSGAAIRVPADDFVWWWE